MRKPASEALSKRLRADWSKMTNEEMFIQMADIIEQLRKYGTSSSHAIADAVDVVGMVYEKTGRCPICGGGEK